MNITIIILFVLCAINVLTFVISIIGDNEKLGMTSMITGVVSGLAFLSCLLWKILQHF